MATLLAKKRQLDIANAPEPARSPIRIAPRSDPRCGTRSRRAAPGTPERATHDYKCAGTSSLYAALGLATGQVIGRLHSRNRSIEFKTFLQTIDREGSSRPRRARRARQQLDTHKTPAVKSWLTAHPRFVFHFTPTSSSWLNLVERWFAELTTKKLRRRAHRSVRELNMRTFLRSCQVDLLTGPLAVSARQARTRSGRLCAPQALDQIMQQRPELDEGPFLRRCRWGAVAEFGDRSVVTHALVPSPGRGARRRRRREVRLRRQFARRELLPARCKELGGRGCGVDASRGTPKDRGPSAPLRIATAAYGSPRTPTAQPSRRYLTKPWKNSRIYVGQL